LLAQTRESKQKLYSVHAPEVECIAPSIEHRKKNRVKKVVKVGQKWTRKILEE
jgi:hypothetical protein